MKLRRGVCVGEKQGESGEGSRVGIIVFYCIHVSHSQRINFEKLFKELTEV